VTWTPRGAVALVLALCVGVGYAVAVVLVILDPVRLSSAGAALLYTTGGALVGAVITYLGGRPGTGGRPDEH
jgi:hypothetical protein